MPIHMPDAYHRIPVEESVLNISLDRIHWQAIGEDDPLTRLLARVQISGTDHHLEAREVRLNEVTAEYEPVEFEEDIAHLIEVAGSGFSEFVQMEGRTYCLFMTPYS